MEECFIVLWYCNNHWKALAIATASYLQWYIHHKAKMDAEAEASNRKCIKDDELCIEPVTKRSKAMIDVDALNTTDSDIEAGQTEGLTSKTSVEVIDDARPSQ
jgi:hypothetical protein